MKIKEAMKLIDEGWVKKVKGFRVRFQKRVDGEWVTDYVPGETDKPLESDVVTWRLAWKLSEVTGPETIDSEKEELFNITVVDDLGNPVNYYRTNGPRVYNQKDLEG